MSKVAYAPVAKKAIRITERFDNTPSTEWDILIRARMLLLMGFATSIVEIETGLTQKRVRRIRQTLQDDGLEYHFARSTKRSTSKTLIATRQQQRHASILMSLYCALHPGHATETDPIALATAYGMFLGTITGESQPSGNLDESVISLSGAWSLAAEVRADEGSVIECMQCNTNFYEAVHQHYQGDHPCPWCEGA